MPNAIIQNFAKKSGKSEEEIDKIWNKLKDQYNDNYEVIIESLKKILKINENFRNWLQENTSFIKEIKEKYKNSFKTINIYEYNNKISIDLIIAKEKNSGEGTKLMKDICEYADKSKKIIILSPSDDFGGNKNRLIKFYKRFEFVENKGKNKDFEIFENMYRLPK